ncbi:MAG: bifunctional riboflavin kinase/FAD synthetase [Pseudomonadota bacterium]
MKIFHDLKAISQDFKNAVIIIGNFDGVHKGHQALIQKAKDIAAQDNKTIGILTFEPHPRQLFQPDLSPSRLTPATLKAQKLKEHGIDFLCALEFDWDFASQSADTFVQNILIEGLGAHHIVIGHDFRFGQMRSGNAQTIRDHKLDLTVVEAIEDQSGDIISSSRIRELIKQAEIQKANALLGWDWEIHGEIFKGDQRGRELGYPTANLLLNDTLHPSYGVYATRVQIEGEDEWRKAATNIGIRPMFKVPTAQVEAHILDLPFSEFYGKKLRVQPVEKLRSEAKFDSLDELIAQMDKDCAKAREIL